jgi:L-rhamnose-H+ transport protein
MFFYARVEANIPARLSYVNWMLRMSGHVLCGGLVGLAPGQSKDMGKRPIQVLRAGALLIIAAANLVGRGTAS